jgi:hypothetical protein
LAGCRGMESVSREWAAETRRRSFVSFVDTFAPSCSPSMRSGGTSSSRRCCT